VELKVALSNPVATHTITLVGDAMAGRAGLPGVRSGRTVRPGAAPQRRLSRTDRTELVRAYVGGAQVKELAATHGVHRVTVVEVAKRAGVPARRRGLNAEQVEEAARLYVHGWSLARLGERFKVDSTTAWRALRARGVAMRDAHGRDR